MSTDRRLATLLTVIAPWLLATSVASAAARDYRIDPVHTRIVFAVEHFGFARSLGTLSGPTGSLRFDPDDWSSAEVDVQIPIERLDLGDADWNARMLKRDFFDAGRHPTARFQSMRVELIDASSARIVGTLTLRGETREVVLQARLNRLARNPLTLRRTAGFSATASFSRSDFGMRGWASAIGDRVELTIEVEATRARRGDSGDAAEPDETKTPPASTRGADRAVAQ